MRGEGQELSLEQWVGHLPSPHRGAKEYRALLCKGKLTNERFDLAQKCINQIDDFLEYRYRGLSGSHVRDTVMGLIDDYGVLVLDKPAPLEEK